MRTTFRLQRREVLKGAGAGFVLAAIPGGRGARAQSLDRFVFQTNWRAQAEHGGYYQAIAQGLYRKAGIDLVMQVGGPGLLPAQVLLGGRCDATISDSFQAFHYVRENLPFRSIAAIGQRNVVCLFAHTGVGNDSLEALRGKPIMMGTGVATGGGNSDSYWGLLTARYGYTDDQLRPYSGNLAPFLVNPQMVMKGYISTEPYVAKKAGADIVVLKLDALDAGDYGATIDTSQKLIDEKPDLLQRFVDASIEGWMQYLKGEDIEGANALIKRDNKDMTDDEIAYARQAWIDNEIVLSGDALKLGVGAMTDARWKRFFAAISDAAKYQTDFDYRRAYTTQFVNKRVGLI